MELFFGADRERNPCASCWIPKVLHGDMCLDLFISRIRMFLIRKMLVLFLELLYLKGSPVVDLVSRNGSWLVSGAGVVPGI